ncbi:hypothetical protein [Streptomyces sp. ISL-11]|uniref:hypothetical protein n=1 Tax=Streptomyces sp. ISL-11 TaxID=2819174 RepID=UPI001BEA152E|nr:hypothetical protein [Streptomyces sp. ISL-11]MBT2386346.1 hypothetical protein [Streptomyces sp. ISL-11]
MTQVESGVAVGGLAKSVEATLVEPNHFTKACKQGRRPVQVQHIRCRRIPVRITVR